MPYKDLTYGSMVYTAEYSEDAGSTYTDLPSSGTTYWLLFDPATLTFTGTPGTTFTALNSYYIKV